MHLLGESPLWIIGVKSSEMHFFTYNPHNKHFRWFFCNCPPPNILLPVANCDLPLRKVEILRLGAKCLERGYLSPTSEMRRHL